MIGKLIGIIGFPMSWKWLNRVVPDVGDRLFLVIRNRNIVLSFVVPRFARTVYVDMGRVMLIYSGKL
jgi:hypothetical protein